jgi:hypothetical protein
VRYLYEKLCLPGGFQERLLVRQSRIEGGILQMKIKVSVGNSRMDKRWNLVEMELEEFRDRIAATKRTAETVEQYKKLSKARQDDIKDVGGFVLGILKNGRRKKDSVVSRSALCLDMDYAEASVIEQIEMFFSFRCWFYSTHKHTPEKPRFRLIVRFRAM